MPETYGMPEPEVPVADKAAVIIAGSGIVRTTILYAVAALLLVTLPPLAVVPLVLLVATDPRLIG